MSSLWRRNNQEKKDNTTFLRNGAILLEKLIISCNGKWNPIRSFCSKELEIATNNFDQHLLMVYGNYELYKGFLQNRSVSIMYWPEYRHINLSEHPCDKNIVFPSKMSHKNVLKLIGCCLETEIPTLVFESAEYGSLADRIHGCPGLHFEPLLLAHRLKIAMEIANAVAYLHIGFRRPIVFRDITPSHILFDEQNVAKLFDFSLAESIPEGETHIKNVQVIGTIGFLDPEYVMTADCNEKSDVFSFGMLLLELLTGKRSGSIYSVADADGLSLLDDAGGLSSLDDDDGLSLLDDYDGLSLLDYVKVHVENNRLNEILDPIMVEDSSCHGKEQQLQGFYQLILECTNKSPEERPTMIYVAKLLRQMYLSVL